jgi:HK97 family phage portal protein
VASPALVTRARDLVSRVFRPSALKQFPGGGYWLPVSGGYLPPDSPWNYFQTGYPANGFSIGQCSAVVAACISAYAQTVAMCPGTHWRTLPNNGRERVTNSALSRILKKPNSYQSTSDFFLNLTQNLYADGNAYALGLRNNRFEIGELHLMNPRFSRPFVAVNGEVFYGLGGNLVVEKTIPKELLAAVPARDVLHIKMHVRPEYPLIGEPPLTSALLDVAASDQMVKQALAYANNQGRPSGVIQTDMQLDEAQTKELRARWDEQTRGQNAGGTPILTWGLKWQQVSSNSRDAQLAELLQISDQRIATAYRVPLALLSLITGQIPQASTEDLINFWLASGLGFALNHIEDAIGRFCGLAGYPDEYLELDTRALQRSNLKDRIDALARGVQGGIYSPNEARALEDLPEADDGDEPRVQQQLVPLSFGAEPPAPPPSPALPPPAPAPTADQANARARANNIIRAAERFRRAV